MTLRVPIPKWLMKEKSQWHRFYPGSGRWGRTSSREGSTVLSCTGVLVVGGTSLSERGREAPKSLDVLEMIEASANMVRWSASVSVSLRLRVPLPPFIDSRRDELHAWEISRVVPFSPNRGRTVDGSCCRALRGMAPGVVVILGGSLTVTGTCPCPVAPVEARWWL